MNLTSLPSQLAGPLIGFTLIFAALANARVAFIISSAGLLAWLIVFPQDFVRRKALPATCAAAVAAVIALVMLLQ